MKQDKRPSKDSDFNYSNTERLLMLIALTMISFTLYLYFTDTSFRHYFFGTAKNEFLSTPVGKVLISDGQVQRQRAFEFEFKSLQKQATLFPNDTIMTGPTGHIIMQFNDGEKLELGPNTLIKLVFDYDFSVGGLVRRKLEPIQQKAPKIIVEQPKPIIKETVIPLQVITSAPKNNAVFQFSKKELFEQKKHVKFTFQFNQPPKYPPSLTLKDPQGVSVFEYEAELNEDLVATTETVISAPGTYTWQILDFEKKILLTNKFLVPSKVQAIETLPVIGATNKMAGFSTSEVFDGFSLRWKKGPGPKAYTVKIYSASNEKLLLKKTLKTNKLIVNKKKLTLSDMYFTVEKTFPNGMIATSDQRSFGFSFLPPTLKSPENNIILTRTDLKKREYLLFFTWTKTNLTKAYQLEIATDQKFRNILRKDKLIDNFYTMKAPRSGQYYWRVRSMSSKKKNLVSPYSNEHRFTIRR